MSYTIKNLNELEDMAPQFGFDAVQEARFAHPALDAKETGLSFMRVKPGCRQAFAHRHDEAEEIYVVIEGSGRVKLDDAVEEIALLDAIRVAPRVARQFEAGDDGLGLLALGPRHEKDGEIISEGIF